MLDLIVFQINSRHFDDLMTLSFNVLQRATQYGEFSFWIIFYLSNLRQVRIQLYMYRYMYLSDFSLISYNMQYNLFWKTKAILAIWGSSFLIVVVIVVVYWCIGIHYIHFHLMWSALYVDLPHFLVAIQKLHHQLWNKLLILDSKLAHGPQSRNDKILLLFHHACGWLFVEV